MHIMDEEYLIVLIDYNSTASHLLCIICCIILIIFKAIFLQPCMYKHVVYKDKFYSLPPFTINLFTYIKF